MTVDSSTARRKVLLDGLDEADLARLLPDPHETALDLGQVLHEPGESIRVKFFRWWGWSRPSPTSAPTIWWRPPPWDGRAWSASQRSCGPTARERAVVQVSGRAVGMGVDELHTNLADVDGPFSTRLARSAQAMFSQVARHAPATWSTACGSRPRGGCS
jgi:hypothetical protein